MKRSNLIIVALAIVAIAAGSVFAALSTPTYVRINDGSTTTKPVGNQDFSTSQDLTYDEIAKINIFDTRTNSWVVKTAYQSNGTSVLYATSATPVTVTVTLP